MKQFFKFMFASMLGTILTFIIGFFIFLGLISSLIYMAEKKEVIIDNNTVLKISFPTPIKERTPNNPFEIFDPTSIEFKKSLGLNDILQNIENASQDDKIKGIYIEVSSIMAGISTIEEIRDALLKFKESGKWIISFSDVYSQGAYYMGSVADEIYMHPEGFMDLKGLNIESIFLKGTLEKLKIEPQILRAGKFKGAVEPFTRENYSNENKIQLSAYVNSLWGVLTEDISKSRNISIDDINSDADALAAFSASAALDKGYVDELVYKDDVISKMKERLEIANSETIKTVSIQQYSFVSVEAKKIISRDKIAVIYAVGNIIQGRGGDGVIGSVTTSEAIKNARMDKNVKAIVMRVNSGGGDGIASDVIWREVMLAKNEKPFVISMGDLAASGGYWISCAADKIIADPTTLTGSIGVFAMIPNMKAMYNEHLGITFDNVKTNKNSNFIGTKAPMSEFQMKVLGREIDRFYDVFLERVAEGRGMTRDQVHEIAQGRIWSGVDALGIGLIDDFGGITEAIKLAADMAEVDDYRIKSLPMQKDPFQELLSVFSSEVRVDNHIKEELGEYYTYYYYLEQMKNLSGIQARLPFEYRIY